MRNLIPYYKCPECGEVHDFSYQAEQCCPHDVIRVYYCTECEGWVPQSDVSKHPCRETVEEKMNNLDRLIKAKNLEKVS